MEQEGQGHDIIMGVTRLLLLGSFYTIQTIPWANILHPSVGEQFLLLTFCDNFDF